MHRGFRKYSFTLFIDYFLAIAYHQHSVCILEAKHTVHVNVCPFSYGF